MVFNITNNTNLLISKLNNKLRVNCPDLQLSIVQDEYGPTRLCLLNNNVWVDELRLSDYENSYTILSNHDFDVDREDEIESDPLGKGYHRFLIALSIYLADTLTDYDEACTETNVISRLHIFAEYDHKIEVEDDIEDDEYPEYSDDEEFSDDGRPPPMSEAEMRRLARERQAENDPNYIDTSAIYHVFLSIKKNKNKAKNIVDKWINNNCEKYKGGKKTRRNKQRRKNKTLKSKNRKTKRSYK
jgi:hypothetical protein